MLWRLPALEKYSQSAQFLGRQALKWEGAERDAPLLESMHLSSNGVFNHPNKFDPSSRSALGELLLEAQSLSVVRWKLGSSWPLPLPVRWLALEPIPSVGVCRS